MGSGYVWQPGMKTAHNRKGPPAAFAGRHAAGRQQMVVNRLPNERGYADVLAGSQVPQRDRLIFSEPYLQPDHDGTFLKGKANTTNRSYTGAAKMSLR
jgi:hypothetical protein